MDLRGRSRHGLLQGALISIVSALQTKLFHARSRICELENEQRSFKKKVKRLQRKVEEERISHLLR
jgi:uncharacterized membrane protein (DUF106 family)